MAKEVLNKDISNKTVVIVLVIVILVSIVSLAVYFNALSKAEPEVLSGGQAKVSLNIIAPTPESTSAGSSSSDKAEVSLNVEKPK